VHCFKNAQVLGVDIDNNYIPACQKLFKENENVTIEHMNFYDLEKNHKDEKFDIIIFGSSFMLMPDQVKAMTEDTRKLMETQKSLMGMLTTMKPMITDGKQMMETFTEMFGKQ
jgi:ubiquinone/menaquinone biosynthesis C-methylase UbiE